MKQHLKPTFFLSLILALTLSGCIQEKPFVEVITEWRPNVAYYGNDRVFHVVSQPSYVDEGKVYEVKDEMELALLAKILFDQGVTQFYLSDGNLSINKTYAYLDALMIYSFKFSMGSKTYSKGDTVVRTLDFVKIELYNDHVSQVNADITAFLAARVKTADPMSVQLKAIHDGLLVTTQYDTAVLSVDLTNITDHTPFEAYGLFTTHKAVCSGYAKAFMGLVQKLDYPVLTVSSTVMNHAWNMVFVNGKWLYVDATWDDPVPDKAGRILETYFLIDLKKITTSSSTIQAHTFDKSGDATLSAQDYLAFATYLFPSTNP